MIKRSILLLVLSVILSTPVYAGVLFFQDFESDTPGQFPSGWNGDSTGSVDWDDIFTVTDDPLRAGQSVRYTDSSPANYYDAYRDFTAQTGGLLVEWDMMKISGGPYFSFQVHDGNLNGANIYFRDDTIAVLTGATTFTTAAPMSLEEWYHLKLNIDIASNMYDVYVDDVLKLSDIPFRLYSGTGPVDSLSRVSVGISTNWTFSGYIDNVYVATADSAVPEPATIVLLLSGLLALPFLRRS